MRMLLPKLIRLRIDRRLIRSGYRNAFTLIELITVIAVISVIMAILLPAVNQVRRQARMIIGTNNQRQIVTAVNLFALDNDDRYPESVATIGDGTSWNWSEPMMLTTRYARSQRLHRSISAYLYSYIKDFELVFCPNAPEKYKYLQQSWDAGDNWENPEAPPGPDPVYGTYCFYWNYTGYIEDRDYLFQGPRNTIGGRRQSKLLVSDYFGYNHHRSRNSYSSCELFEDSSIVEGTVLSSYYWACTNKDESEKPDIKLQAGYIDGHVEKFSSLNTFTLRVIINPRTGGPYPEGTEPGKFFLPGDALY